TSKAARSSAAHAVAPAARSCPIAHALPPFRAGGLAYLRVSASLGRCPTVCDDGPRRARAGPVDASRGKEIRPRFLVEARGRLGSSGNLGVPSCPAADRYATWASS